MDHGITGGSDRPGSGSRARFGDGHGRGVRSGAGHCSWAGGGASGSCSAVAFSSTGCGASGNCIAAAFSWAGGGGSGNCFGAAFGSGFSTLSSGFSTRGSGFSSLTSGFSSLNSRLSTLCSAFSTFTSAFSNLGPDCSSVGASGAGRAGCATTMAAVLAGAARRHLGKRGWVGGMDGIGGVGGADGLLHCATPQLASLLEDVAGMEIGIEAISCAISKARACASSSDVGMSSLSAASALERRLRTATLAISRR
mmetsp:Transcript_58527/g.136143  ORF Transcript_58527/g.136143 Transcript_58527/m.136143 type:complete len:253 (-) Transcript_58527:259-1017(-)